MVDRRAIIKLKREKRGEEGDDGGGGAMMIEAETGPLLRDVKPFAPYGLLWLVPFVSRLLGEVVVIVVVIRGSMVETPDVSSSRANPGQRFGDYS